MSVNTQPVFGKIPLRGRCRLTGANTTRDLSSLANAVLLCKVGADGGFIEEIRATHVAASQTQAAIACIVRIFICDDDTGASPRLLCEITCGGTAPSATAPGMQAFYTPAVEEPLEPNQALYATMSVAQTSGAMDIISKGWKLSEIA